MSSTVAHLQLNISPDHLPYYRDLFGKLGWQTLYDEHGFLGLGGAGGPSLWFAGVSNGHANDYDGPGLNHLAIGLPSVAEVDAMAAWLTERGTALLFDTPRHRPEFAGGEDQTYYQIMFETPDRILVEFVYTGLKDG